MPKEDIRMSAEEIDRFLRSQSRAVVVAGAAGHAPDGAVGRFHYDDGRVAFSLRGDDPVLEQLDVDDRACCIVEQFPSYYEIKSVMLHGRARRRADRGDDSATFDLEVAATVSFDFSRLTGNPARPVTPPAAP